MKEKDPEINLNVDALLPKLPPKSRGPHEDIVHGAMVNIQCTYPNKCAYRWFKIWFNIYYNAKNLYILHGESP